MTYSNHLIARAGAREVRITPTITSAGQNVIVPIAVDVMGDESVYGFSLSYDSTKLSNPVVTIGNAGGSVSSNTTQAGQIGVSVTYGGGTATAGNNKVLVNVQFTVANNAATGQIPISFTDTPTFREVASAPGATGGVQALPTTFTNGNLTITGTTAATVPVSGRVLTTDGRGITNIRMILTDSHGQIRTATSAASGNYRFENVEVGETYTITATGKRFTFSQPSQVLNVSDEVSEINFIGNAVLKFRDFK